MERITSAQPPPCVPKHPPVDIADMQRFVVVFVFF